VETIAVHVPDADYQDMFQRAKPAGKIPEDRLRAAIALVHKGPPQSFSALFSVEQPSIAEENEPQRTQRTQRKEPISTLSAFFAV